MIDLNATWKTPAAAEFAGIGHERLQLWFKRGFLFGDGMTGGGSQGNHRQLNFKNIMEIEVARPFADQGLSPQASTLAAARVAYSISKESNGEGFEVLREAGFPFPGRMGGTLALAYGGKTEIVTTSDAQLHGAFLSSVEAMTVVNVTRIFNDVCARMGHDPEEVLSEVYGTAPRLIMAKAD